MTTYILGAGASFHAGYPLASELGDALVAWLAQNPNPVNEMYGSNLRELYKLYGNLQDLDQVLTDLEDCPLGSRAATMNAAARRYARRNMKLMIPEFFRFLRQRPASLYERLARERIQPGDVVITFNYDLALERELRRAGLWEISNGYGFSLGIEAIPQSSVAILKLHGSVNWLEVAFSGMRGFSQGPPNAFGSRPVVFPGEFDFLGYAADIRDPLAPSGSAGAFPAIIMPGLKKRSYEQTSFWNDLWASAESALWSCERIVMIGYSMPRADEDARSLLLEKSNRNATIEIFCGGGTSKISEMFSARGFRCEISARGHHFEDFLNDTIRRSA